jgi:hypothetical protein
VKPTTNLMYSLISAIALWPGQAAAADIDHDARRLRCQGRRSSQGRTTSQRAAPIC